MSTSTYTEDHLVEQPAIALFAELGWQTANAMEEKFGPNDTLGRETSGEVVLAPRLRTALEKLNPKLPAEAIAAAVEELSRDRSAMTLERLNTVLALGWRQKVQARAKVRIAIEDTLDEGLPRAYSKDIYRSKCDALFEHVYESYYGDGASLYAT